MQDLLYRGVLDDLKIRFSYCLLSDCINAGVVAHQCDPIAAHVFGRALTSAILTAPWLEDDERLTMQWFYYGALEVVIVEIDALANVRGYIVPHQLHQSVTAPADVHGEGGRVSVIKSTSKKVISSGIINAELLDVVDDLSLYYAMSEQVETAITALIAFEPDDDLPGCWSQGVMIQALPGCDLLFFDRCRQCLALGEARQLLAQKPVNDNHFELIMKAIFAEHLQTPPIIGSMSTPMFRCRCTRDKILEITNTLEKSEIDELSAKDQTLDIRCHFCNTAYKLSGDEISAFNSSCS
jgi:molecular chaperone Hsp33